MPKSLPPHGLTIDGIKRRQSRLRERLRTQGLDAALITHPSFVVYLTGHWSKLILHSALLIPAEGASILATPSPAAANTYADVKTTFPGFRPTLIIDDQPSEAIKVVTTGLKPGQRIGVDDGSRPWLLREHHVESLLPTLIDMKRCKDADELAQLRRAIAGCEAAYARAREIVRPGLREIDMYAELHAAAVKALREPIGEFGNDFQSGALGGPPRDRAMRAGELMPLDMSVQAHGYWSDMCRTFCVGGKPSPRQREAQKLVMQAMAHVEATVKPGVSARRVYQDVFRMIDGRNGWTFPHHLGHGFGVFVHEGPRLNGAFDDAFREGDVFTCEPGAYGDDLRGGVRIEQNYLVTKKGVERLTSFPTELL